MARSSVRRRRLAFHSWEEVLADADRLASGGYDRAGKWSLAQAVDHIGAGLRVAVAGSTKRMPWVMRMSARSIAAPMIRAWRWMPAGIPAPVWWQPQVPAEADVAAGVARFRAEVEAFRAHVGPYHAHPAFDCIDRQAYEDLMLIHASHHLGFLVPKGAARA